MISFLFSALRPPPRILLLMHFTRRLKPHMKLHEIQCHFHEVTHSVTEYRLRRRPRPRTRSYKILISEDENEYEDEHEKNQTISQHKP